MESTLEELYYGGIRPAEQRRPQTEEYRALQKLCGESSDRLYESLDERQKRLYLEFEERRNARGSREDCQAFVQGFSLAVRLLMEAMTGE